MLHPAQFGSEGSVLRIVLGRRLDMTHIQVSEGDDNGGEKAKQRILGYLQKGIQTPMAQGRSTNIISMIRWIRTSTSSIQNSLSGRRFRKAMITAENKAKQRAVESLTNFETVKVHLLSTRPSTAHATLLYS